MFNHNIRIPRPVAGLALAAAMALSASVPAFADDGNVSITGGSLNWTTVEPTIGDFAAVTLNGTDQSTTATLTGFGVTDATGTGAGWKVTVSATQFKEHNGTAYVTSGKTLPTGSMSLAAPTVSQVAGTSSAVPTMSNASGFDDGNAGTSSIIASAAVNAGMGQYDFSTSTVTLSLPNETTKAGTYRSDVTITLASGPS